MGLGGQMAGMQLGPPSGPPGPMKPMGPPGMANPQRPLGPPGGPQGPPRPMAPPSPMGPPSQQMGGPPRPQAPPNSAPQQNGVNGFGHMPPLKMGLVMHLKCLPYHFHINQVLLEVLLDLWEVPRGHWEPL